MSVLRKGGVHIGANSCGWGTAEFIDENALQVNFTRLRKTLREVGLGDRIETVRGQGYRLKERVEI